MKAAANLLAQLFEVAPYHVAVQPTIALYRHASEPGPLNRRVEFEMLAAEVLRQTALAAPSHPNQIGRARAELAVVLGCQ